MFAPIPATSTDERSWSANTTVMPPPRHGGAGGQVGPGGASQENLPPAPGAGYRVFRMADGSIVAVKPNENPGTLLYIPSYIWVDGQWEEDLGDQPMPEDNKNRSGGVQGMADDDDGGEGGGGGGEGGGGGPGDEGIPDPGSDLPGPADLIGVGGIYVGADGGLYAPDGSMVIGVFNPDNPPGNGSGLSGNDTGAPPSLLDVPEGLSGWYGGSLGGDSSYGAGSGGGVSGSDRPDPWAVGNMVDAILGQTDFSGATQHYQTQAKSDPIGTLREIQAVTARMAQTHPREATAFARAVAGVVPAASGQGPKSGISTRLGNATTPPAYKAGIFAKQPGAWEGFNKAVGNLPKVSSAEKFAYGQIFAAEGGNIKDPAGSAVAGILQKTLDDARGRVPGLSNARTPGDLRPDQQAALYRDYLNQALAQAGGYQALNGIGSDYAAAVLADTLFRFGPSGGASIIQSAINSVAPGSVQVGGGMGPQTMAVYIQLAANPATLWQLLKAIGDERDLKLKGKEADRNDQFRFLK